MADGRHSIDDNKKLEPVVAPAADGEQVTLRKFLEEAYAELGKLGIGPLSNVKDAVALLPPEALSQAPVDGVNPLILPIKLELPALKFEGDGYSVSIAPTGNLLKHKGGIEVTGTFSSL